MYLLIIERIVIILNLQMGNIGFALLQNYQEKVLMYV